MADFLIDDRFGLDDPALGSDGLPIASPFGGLGKWGRLSVPPSGWKYARDEFGGPVIIEIEDEWTPENLALFPKCEMCEAQRIKIVHALEHPDYPQGFLQVGYECAAHMIGDPDLVADLEKLKCKAVWRSTADGNRHIVRIRGLTLIVKRVGQGFKGEYHHTPTGFRRSSVKIHALDAAKRVTVQAAIKARIEKPWVEVRS